MINLVFVEFPISLVCNLPATLENSQSVSQTCLKGHLYITTTLSTMGTPKFAQVFFLIYIWPVYSNHLSITDRSLGSLNCMFDSILQEGPGAGAFYFIYYKSTDRCTNLTCTFQSRIIFIGHVLHKLIVYTCRLMLSLNGFLQDSWPLRWPSGSMLATHVGDRGSIPGWVIPNGISCSSLSIPHK